MCCVIGAFVSQSDFQYKRGKKLEGLEKTAHTPKTHTHMHTKAQLKAAEQAGVNSLIQ